MTKAETLAGVFSLFPGDDATPLVFDSPHSGTVFPSDFRTALDPTLVLRTSDLFVDRLFAGVVRHGADLLVAHFPRAYIDVNRGVDDLDEALIEPGFPKTLRPSEKSRLGKGLIWRVALGGRSIYAKRLSVADVQRRIEAYYEPYHARLAGILSDRQSRFGSVWHVNCHSMKSMSTDMDAEGSGINRADIVISDRLGKSAETDFVACARKALEDEGLAVAINDPFKGAEIIRRHGRPDERRHAIQIEINRALYMNERTLETHDGFESMQRVIYRVSATLVDYCRSRI